ncbi:MAG: DMT family transporter [Ghiorsea sp.]|nr:DMT family transporter [Ghiorsea sp.]
MPIPIAYLGVVLIWSTTPLAIAWSGQAAGFVFGVTSRMLLGLILAFIFAALINKRVLWHKQALLAYLYGGLGIYGGMLSVYWAAQFIPSGLVSLLFGLTPIFTAILAIFWLKNELITRYRIIGMLLGFFGLLVVFGQSITWGEQAVWGVCGVIVSGLIHVISAIWVKRVNAHVPAISMTAGTLCVATPLLLITWLAASPDWQALSQTLVAAPSHTTLAILYLALFGSVFGFSLYFHVLKHVEATKVALIALMTPITSLFLGYYLNQEPITPQIMLGASLIIGGLAIFELGGKPLPKWVPFRPNV